MYDLRMMLYLTLHARPRDRRRDSGLTAVHASSAVPSSVDAN